MYKVGVIGATGTIGVRALDVISTFPDRFRCHLISANGSEKKLHELASTYGANLAVLTGIDKKHEKVGATSFYYGNSALADKIPECDCIVMGISGTAALMPTVVAAKSCKRLAIASKEPLVIAGRLISGVAKKSKCEIIPIDSEHSAAFQLLRMSGENPVALAITASGGPFLNSTESEFRNATVEQALKHPTWQMGKKITIDSATLMNKSLEIIEAVALFALDPRDVRVVIHPQSLVHALIELADASVLAFVSAADMRIPIQYALTHPDRFPCRAKPMNLFAESKLTFATPDLKRYRGIGLAYKVLQMGDGAITAFNAANEEADYAFLAGKIRLPDIYDVVEETIAACGKSRLDSLEEIVECDTECRRIAGERIKSKEFSGAKQ